MPQRAAIVIPTIQHAKLNEFVTQFRDMSVFAFEQLGLIACQSMNLGSIWSLIIGLFAVVVFFQVLGKKSVMAVNWPYSIILSPYSFEIWMSLIAVSHLPVCYILSIPSCSSLVLGVPLVCTAPLPLPAALPPASSL